MRRNCYGKSIFIHFTCIIFSSLILRAQSLELKFDSYPATIAHCFHQDQQGFIWIGTQEGLLRYDGYDFRNFTNIPFDSSSLSHNWIIDIKGDSLGNLWIVTFGGGLNYFDQKKEVFLRYAGSSDKKQNNYVTKIVVDEDGSLWFTGLTHCLTNFNLNKNGEPEYKHYDFFNGTAANSLSDSNSSLTLIKDKTQILWIGTADAGLIKFDRESGAVKNYRYEPDNPFSLSNNTINCLAEDEYGNIWIGTGFPDISPGSGLCVLDKNTGKFRRFVHEPADPTSICENSISSIIIDRTGIMWIGTWFNYLNTVSLRELIAGDTPIFHHHAGLKSSSVLGLYEDRLGNIWIGERAPYLQKYDRRQNPFKRFKRDNEYPKSLTATGTHSVFVDRSGNIWFGTGGLDLYEPEKDKFTHYYHDPFDKSSISANWIYGFAEDSSGNIFVATRNKGVNVIDRISGRFRVLGAGKYGSNSVAFGITDYILASRTGGLWIASQNLGILLFDTHTGEYSSFDLDPATNEDLMVSNLTEDNNGVLWIGTSSRGIYSLKLNEIGDPEISHYQYDPDDSQSISCNSVSDIIQPEVYDTSALWIATSSGLNRFDMKSGEFTHYFQKDGLSTNFVLSILEDDSGNLWCSTSNGLSMYKISSGEIMNYGSKDGLPFSSFGAFRQCAAKGPDGRLYFSGGQGVLYFRPDEILENPNIPPIRITDFKIFEKSVKLDTSIQFKRSIQLNHDQNMFSFNFSALNYTNSEKNQYAYKMEGFYDDWIYIGNERTAAFTNLNPGEYKFTVKGSNNHGHWNEEGAAINVIILPPWWRTAWAYIGYLAVILMIAYSLRKYDLNRQRLKHELFLEHDHAEKLRQIDRMKSRFFANISHEFRTPLTLILGPIEKWMHRLKNHELRNDLSMMKRNANRLLRLINQLLDLSRLESGGMILKMKEEDLVKVVHRYVQSFESLARLKGIRLNFESEKEIIHVFTDRDKIEKIVYNLLSNAFKYTPEGGEVKVSISEENLRDSVDTKAFEQNSGKDIVKIEVFNSGSYITQNEINHIFDRFYQSDDSATRLQEGSGIGLALTKELVGLLEGNISARSIRDLGTTNSKQKVLIATN